ncbi:MAG: hypothetical protein AAB036_08470 [Elusimicrobiota bacterium]|jgi:hypothetical protein
MNSITLVGYLGLSLLGRAIASKSLVGVMIITAIAGLAYAGIRISRDPRFSRAVQRCGLFAGLFFVIFGAISLLFAAIDARTKSFHEWHKSGASIQVGMAVAEARSILDQRSRVIKQEAVGNGVQFQIEPTGLAQYEFDFPLKREYFIDVDLDKQGKIAGVRSIRN